MNRCFRTTQQRGVVRSPAYAMQLTFSSRVLTIALALGLWIASGSLALAILEDLGPHPVRRVLIGGALVASLAVALWRRDAVCAASRARPWLVVVIALAQLAIVAVDGLVGGPYVVVTYTAIGLASIVANARLMWICVVVLEAGYLSFVLTGLSPVTHGDEGILASVLGEILGYPFAAIVVLGLATMFKRFLAGIDGTLESVRAGGGMLTPALAQAVALGGGRRVLMLPAPSPLQRLTAREIEVVRSLAAGMRPKQIAFERHVSLAAVRKHIAQAKRKTGARTLSELAAMTARSDWPGAA